MTIYLQDTYIYITEHWRKNFIFNLVSKPQLPLWLVYYIEYSFKLERTSIHYFLWHTLVYKADESFITFELNHFVFVFFFQITSSDSMSSPTSVHWRQHSCSQMSAAVFPPKSVSKWLLTLCYKRAACYIIYCVTLFQIQYFALQTQHTKISTIHWDSSSTASQWIVEGIVDCMWTFNE